MRLLMSLRKRVAVALVASSHGVDESYKVSKDSPPSASDDLGLHFCRWRVGGRFCDDVEVVLEDKSVGVVDSEELWLYLVVLDLFLFLFLVLVAVLLMLGGGIVGVVLCLVSWH